MRLSIRLSQNEALHAAPHEAPHPHESSQLGSLRGSLMSRPRDVHIHCGIIRPVGAEEDRSWEHDDGLMSLLTSLL